ncbi:hypothetical protein NP233_g3014 [Leucocoprinus birnbaumii]|uniref:Deacetylase sirtuin-type domain-containing protein n=1 Tax=Leucocoprinus birnbaumii TaxID=56174 RepID=A0AAD5W0D7_9AGAR|nr:hypothetical protein NP233_g3014 [Leucocoprinus birnbaumii]
MTFFLPLDPSAPLPTTPSFLAQSSNTQTHIQKVIQTILKAKRIVVICGAGISVRAGIPDFRSPEGLFRTLKRDNPRENLASGKDLFDASVFNAEHTTSLFCQMIAQLSKLSQDAEPTAFHRVLRALDDHGKLLRVYTQNIDAIEQKAGLSFGVPEYEDRRGKNRHKGKAPANQLPGDKQQAPQTDTAATLSGPAAGPTTIPSSSSTSSGPSSSTRLPSPPAETPRCIPLHGTLQSVHCQVCTHSFPLREHLASLVLGQPPQCPECTSLERTRQLVGKRPRGIGRLRPSVVLYNEDHKDGEGVGEVVSKDLMGSKGRSGADLLLVVGTSLRVPGTKRMVREFSKAVKPRTTKDKEDGTSSGSSTPSSSTRSAQSTSNSIEEEQTSSMKAVYLNLDFPVPTREWEGVFDVWLQGDAQQFASLLQDELEKQAKAKELAIEKKRKKDEEAALAAANASTEESSSLASTQPPVTPKPTKRKPGADSTTTKRRKVAAPSVTLPPSPPKSPPTLYAKSRQHSNDSDSMDVDVDIDIEDDMDVLPTLPLLTSSGASSSSSSPSSYSSSVESFSPLMIRIPPRCYVNVPSLPLLKTPYRPPNLRAQTMIQLPPTPEDTPPSRFKFPRTNTSPASSMTSTNTAKRTPPNVRFDTCPSSIHELTSSIKIIEIGLSEDEINDYDALPISCLRSTQIGLAPSALSPDHG